MAVNFAGDHFSTYHNSNSNIWTTHFKSEDRAKIYCYCVSKGNDLKSPGISECISCPSCFYYFWGYSIKLRCNVENLTTPRRELAVRNKKSSILLIIGWNKVLRTPKNLSQRFEVSHISKSIL